MGPGSPSPRPSRYGPAGINIEGVVHLWVQFVDLVDDFLEGGFRAWTPTKQLRSARLVWRKHELARSVAYQRPWSDGVLRCLEVSAYRQSAEHGTRLISELLGISRREVDECLELLIKSEQIAWSGTHWVVERELAIELGADPAAARALSSWWFGIASERSLEGRRGMFAYNLCSVSAKDLQKLAELQRDYLRQVRSVVAGSTPERVALIVVQVMGLEQERSSCLETATPRRPAST